MEFIETISGFLWDSWAQWSLLVVGVLFTVWTRFTQYTAMTHGIAVVRGLYDDPNDPGAINHFQALSAALSATVGLGNIGGVAFAIGIGGPGALFWMWIVALTGMALKSVEITLTMMYRNTDDPNNPSGGAMWVVEKVIGSKGGVWKPIARIIGIFFCITLLISAMTGGNMFQAWSVATLSHEYFGVPRLVTGIVMAVLVGLVIIGGIKRIGSVAGKLVPFMCVVYLISALAVLAMHVTEIPGLLWLVVSSAFRPTEAYGAFLGGSLGFAFMQGMKRALFSNEAGQGSAPIAHAAAKTDEPAREGIVGGIGPFIDTICICTITALVILSTGTWNRGPDGVLTDKTAYQEMFENAPIDRLPREARVRQISKNGDWAVGSKVYTILEVHGASHRSSGQTRVKIAGEITDVIELDKANAAIEYVVEWDEIDFPLDKWTATPTSLTFPDEHAGNVFYEYSGPNLTAHAFDRQFPGLGRWLVSIAAWLFAISTMISWSYYGEQGMIYLAGQRSVLAYKLVYLLGTVYAAAFINTEDEMIPIIDLGTGAMLWSNIPIVVVLGFLAVRCLRDYEGRLRRGEMIRRNE